MNHTEHAEKAKSATPCAAWHITFGGRCLNCGFDPSVPDTRMEQAVGHARNHRAYKWAKGLPVRHDRTDWTKEEIAAYEAEYNRLSYEGRVE